MQSWKAYDPILVQVLGIVIVPESEATPLNTQFSIVLNCEPKSIDCKLEQYSNEYLPMLTGQSSKTNASMLEQYWKDSSLSVVTVLGNVIVPSRAVQFKNAYEPTLTRALPHGCVFNEEHFSKALLPIV